MTFECLPSGVIVFHRFVSGQFRLSISFGWTDSARPISTKFRPSNLENRIQNEKHNVASSACSLAFSTQFAVTRVYDHFHQLF